MEVRKEYTDAGRNRKEIAYKLISVLTNISNQLKKVSFRIKMFHIFG